jgi:hypothetical protein
MALEVQESKQKNVQTLKLEIRRLLKLYFPDDNYNNLCSLLKFDKSENDKETAKDLLLNSALDLSDDEIKKLEEIAGLSIR